MRRAGLKIIALVIGTALSGAAWAQTSGGGAATGGGGATGGGSSVGVPLGPSTPGTAAPNPLNPSAAVGTPTRRTTTGINQNEQLRNSPDTQPAAVIPGRAGGTVSDMPAGTTDTRTGRSTIGGTATGRVPQTSNAATGVDGPGQLSPPTAFELYSGRVPRTP
jgi:hypothetical protein